MAESKQTLFWGYRHTSGTIQAKRYTIPLDIQEAEESDFCETVYGPFEANNREEAIAHIKDIIKGVKNGIKEKDESLKRLEVIKEKNKLKSAFEAGEAGDCEFDTWYNENH